MTFEESLKSSLNELVIDKEYIDNNPPEFLKYRIDQIIKLLEPQIMEAKTIFMEEEERVKIKTGKLPTDDAALWASLPHSKAWKNHQQLIEIEFGKWSHIFNKLLRDRIRHLIHKDIKENKSEIEKLNNILLYWMSAKNFILASNTPNSYSTLLLRMSSINSMKYLGSLIEEKKE